MRLTSGSWTEIIDKLNKNIDKTYLYPDNKKLGRCWLWLGGETKYGYGYVYFFNSRFAAHRLSYVALGGNDLKDTDEVHHRCLRRLCVRPSHLEKLDKLEHIARHKEMRKL